MLAASGVLFILFLLFFFSPQIAQWHYQRTKEKVETTVPALATEELDRLFSIQTQLFQILGGLAVLIGIYVTWRRARVAEKALETTNRNLEITERGHFTERFTKAIEQLGSAQSAIQLGGVYALEKLAKDNPTYHNTIFETLCAFVRNRVTFDGEKEKKIRAAKGKDDNDGENEGGTPSQDSVVTAIISVIGRRNQEPHEYEYLINLQKVDLRNIIFSQIYQGRSYFAYSSFERSMLEETSFASVELERASFGNAWLGKANFTKAHLLGVHFRQACLEKASFASAMVENANFWNVQAEGASFWKAHLQYANFGDALLQGVNFGEANLKRATFENALLRKSIFERSNLEGVNFMGADLTDATFGGEILNAKTLYKAYMNAELRKFIQERKPELLEEVPSK